MKIKSVVLVNYRAFLNKDEEEYKRYELLLPAGENLLIYGENGSGKSSLFKGLKDFFASALNPDLLFQHNSFYVPADNSEQPFIRLKFDDDSAFSFSMDRAATDTPGSTAIRTGSLNKGFIGYRDLLRLHFSANTSQPDLFNFFLGRTGLFSETILLTPALPENKISYGELFEKISDTPSQPSVDDYNLNFFALITEITTKINLLIQFFHEELIVSIDYTDGRIDEGVFVKPTISFRVNFYGEDIDFSDFLNEARITSLAISVYLAHIISLPDTPLKILFLDDIFIGLDNSNRLPLLKILTKSDLGDGSTFTRHQIFLTTYDREWFEFAKAYLKQGWIKSEFYVDQHSLKYERPYFKKSKGYRDAAWSSFLKFDYPSSANYLRKAIENLIRNILPENLLHQGFNANTGEGSHFIVSKSAFKLVEGDDEWYFKGKATDEAEIQTFHFMGLEVLLKRFEILVETYKIPFENLKNLRLIKDRLLNPLSHDNSSSPVYKNELLLGFDIVDELQKIKSEIILSLDAGDVVLEIECKDHLGVTYYYIFELLENLRFLQYNGFQVFINAKCRSMYRQSHYGAMEVNVKDYPSIAKLCEGVFFMSDVPGTIRTVSVTQFMLDNIYNLDEQNLADLI